MDELCGSSNFRDVYDRLSLASVGYADTSVFRTMINSRLVTDNQYFLHFFWILRIVTVVCLAPWAAGQKGWSGNVRVSTDQSV